MNQERKGKRKGIYKVGRVFEPDRMAPVNLQTAYEQLLSPERYRIVQEQKDETITQAIEMAAEVSS